MADSPSDPTPTRHDSRVRWPELTISDWVDTRDTLQLWTQIVGKVRLALEPMMNQWWQVPLYVSARGLTTSLMHTGDHGRLDIEIRMLARPVEVVVAIPFAEDYEHRAYDPDAAHRFWLALLQSHRIMNLRPDGPPISGRRT